MERKEEKIIMYDSPEAATPYTLAGWIDIERHFHQREEQARYASHTHSKCGGIAKRGYVKCEDCRRKAQNERYTKSNPGCFHSMISYLSELTGLSAKKEIRINSLSAIRNPKSKKLLYKSYDIKVWDKEGNSFPYLNLGDRFDKRGIVADYFTVEVYRDMAEFNYRIDTVGSHKDWEGDGYFTVPLYKIDNQYFAPLMCAHC